MIDPVLPKALTKDFVCWATKLGWVEQAPVGAYEELRLRHAGRDHPAIFYRNKRVPHGLTSNPQGRRIAIRFMQAHRAAEKLKTGEPTAWFAVNAGATIGLNFIGHLKSKEEAEAQAMMADLVINEDTAKRWYAELARGLEK